MSSTLSRDAVENPQKKNLTAEAAERTEKRIGIRNKKQKILLRDLRACLPYES